MVSEEPPVPVRATTESSPFPLVTPGWPLPQILFQHQGYSGTTSCVPHVGQPVVCDATLAKISSRTMMVTLYRSIS